MANWRLQRRREEGRKEVRLFIALLCLASFKGLSQLCTTFLVCSCFPVWQISDVRTSVTIEKPPGLLQARVCRQSSALGQLLWVNRPAIRLQNINESVSCFESVMVSTWAPHSSSTLICASNWLADLEVRVSRTEVSKLPWHLWKCVDTFWFMNVSVKFQLETWTWSVSVSFYLEYEFLDPGSLGQEVKHGEAGVWPHRGHGHPVTSSRAGTNVVGKPRQVVHERVHPAFV